MRHVKVEGKTENLEELVSGGWFDTVNAGMKNEKGSYEKIAEEMKVSLSFLVVAFGFCGDDDERAANMGGIDLSGSNHVP